MSDGTELHPVTDEDLALAARLRPVLRALPVAALPITYRALAQRLELKPPHTIHRLTSALEVTMREDVARGVPMIAALVTSRWRGGLPAPGFFTVAAALGRHDGSANAAFYRREFEAAVAHWLASER